ncbi:hypothetical protein [Clostridium mobile]
MKDGLNKFEKVHPYAFSSELDFMSVGEYLDGTFLFEFNPEKKTYSRTDEVIKDKLIRFGVVGHGVRTYFNALTGVFTFDQNKIEILYRTKDRDYILMGQDVKYNDIIYFKNAYSQMNYSGKSSTNFCGYNFGYKNQILYNDGTMLYFKPILNIPVDQPANFQIRLVSNKDMDGQIIIKVNDFKEYKLNAPLDKNVGGELTWFIRV